MQFERCFIYVSASICFLHSQLPANSVCTASLNDIPSYCMVKCSCPLDLHILYWDESSLIYYNQKAVKYQGQTPWTKRPAAQHPNPTRSYTHTHTHTHTQTPSSNSMQTEEPGDRPWDQREVKVTGAVMKMRHWQAKGFNMWLNCSQPLLLSIISVSWHVTSCGVSFIRDDDWLRYKTEGWHPCLPSQWEGDTARRAVKRGSHLLKAPLPCIMTQLTRVVFSLVILINPVLVFFPL